MGAGAEMPTSMAADSGAPAGAPGPPEQDGETFVRGITISCQSYGPEWGTPGFEDELVELQELGANWVAIHPYAGISADGTVAHRGGREGVPEWLRKPVRVARERGMRIFVKPHIAYWGSPFSWRGEIEFQDPEKRRRFFTTYSEWILSLSSALTEADAFSVGTELDKLIEHEAQWRELIAKVRGTTRAKLTYAANWPDYQRVGFWDALDAVGVQAYFPLVAEGELPRGDARIYEGWSRVLDPLRELSEQTGKPVIFTELGYNISLEAASRPWEYASARGEDRKAALALQESCFRVALGVLERERAWLRGAFLWKWFVGEAPRANFLLDTPEVRRVIAGAWAGP